MSTARITMHLQAKTIYLDTNDGLLGPRGANNGGRLQSSPIS